VPVLLCSLHFLLDRCFELQDEMVLNLIYFSSVDHNLIPLEIAPLPHISFVQPDEAMSLHSNPAHLFLPQHQAEF